MSQTVRVSEKTQAAGPHVLPKLPYDLDALVPHISRSTLELHYGKHHAGYVKKLNQLIPGTAFAQAPLEEIIRLAPEGPIFNNAAQIWNHTFYWNCLGPHRGEQPTGTLAKAIDRAFGSFDGFRTEFSKHANALFGSGWVWLVKNRDGSLSLEETANAGTPVRAGHIPVLTCDVWEHAYYLDYRNERARYVDAWWKVVNWEAAARHYDGDAPGKD